MTNKGTRIYTDEKERNIVGQIERKCGTNKKSRISRWKGTYWGR